MTRRYSHRLQAQEDAKRAHREEVQREKKKAKIIEEVQGEKEEKEVTEEEETKDKEAEKEKEEKEKEEKDKEAEKEKEVTEEEETKDSTKIITEALLDLLVRVEEEEEEDSGLDSLSAFSCPSEPSDCPPPKFPDGRIRNPNLTWFVKDLEMEKERLQQLKRETEERLAAVQNDRDVH